MRAASCLAAALMAAPACAQSPDPSLVALAGSLRAAVAARDAAAIESALSARFVALECSGDPLKPCAPGKAKTLGAKSLSPADRLRLAICCDGKPAPDTPRAEQYETLFAVLGATLSESFAPNPDDRKAVCSPALPAFDRAKAARAVKAAGTEPENLRIAGAEIALRAQPSAEAPVVRALQVGEVAPLVTDLTSQTPAGWTAVGVGAGRALYTNALGLEELTPAALCFGKEGAGWRIVYAIQRGG